MNPTILNEFSNLLGSDNVKLNESLKNHTAIRIGGIASLYLIVNSIEKLVKAALIAKKNNFPVFVIGTGTSFIASDSGINGIVIRNNCRGFKIISDVPGKVAISAESGTLTNQLVKFTVDNCLSGLEYLYGLPGTIGGAVCMNAGLPRQNSSISKSVVGVTILSDSGDKVKIDAS